MRRTTFFKQEECMQSIKAKLRQIARWMFVLIIIGLGAQSGRLIYSRLKAQGLRIGGPIPYTVTLREVIHRPDGSSDLGFEITWAVRADGSTVRRIAHKERINAKKLADPTSERTIQLVSGAEVAINEIANTKTSTIAKNVDP